MPHVCPWWGGYFLDNRFRRWLHRPERILAPYVVQGMTVMDFGCGMGLFSLAAAELVGAAGRVIAVDLQQRMLDVLGRRAAKAGVLQRIHLHRSEPDRIGLQEPCDLVLAFWSAHEVPQLAQLFTDIRACLRPEGRFLLAEPVGHVGPKAFRAMLSLADQLGFQCRESPRIRWSRAAVLTLADGVERRWRPADGAGAP